MYEQLQADNITSVFDRYLPQEKCVAIFICKAIAVNFALTVHAEFLIKWGQSSAFAVTTEMPYAVEAADSIEQHILRKFMN